MPKHGKTKRRSRTQRRERVLTIPELRKSMDYITTYGHSLMKGGSRSDKELASAFAAEWKKVFGKKLSPKIALSYVKHLKGKRGTRKQRGGATLAGAPLDYMTRPGVPLPYGNYLDYVQKGFWNPEPAILQDCGKQTGVMPSATVGTNAVGVQGGGGLLDFVSQSIGAITMRPFMAQNPIQPQGDGMFAAKGTHGGPGPESWQQTWQPKMTGAQLPPLSAIAVYNRDVPNKDVLTR